MSVLELDPIGIALFIAAMTLTPLALMMTTSFLKISIVLVVVRNALGVQQAPPTMVLNGVALALTIFIMAPTIEACIERFQALGAAEAEQYRVKSKLESQIEVMAEVVEPLRQFLIRNSRADQRRLFVSTAKAVWSSDVAKREVKEDSWLVLIPAFVLTELQAGFEIGFLMYIPFLLIDLLISNVLLALGMQMVSPVMISLPLKIFLFVVVDGWGKLLHSLALSYNV